MHRYLLLQLSSQEVGQFTIEIMDDEALQFFNRDAEIKMIGSEFTWTEGPLNIDDMPVAFVNKSNFSPRCFPVLFVASKLILLRVHYGGREDLV